MSLPSVSTPAATKGDARLHGASLFIARAAWFVVTIAVVGLDIIGVPAAYVQSKVPCATSPTASAAFCISNLDAEQMRRLTDLGMSTNVYAAFNVAVMSVTTLIFVLIGVIIFWRRSDNRVALLGSFALVTFGATFGGQTYGGTMGALTVVSPLWDTPVGLARILADVSFAAFFCLFPSGEWVPRWTRWAVVAWFVDACAQEFFPDSPVNQPGLLGGVLFVGLVSTLIIAQVFRYRYVSTPTQRQQTKWAVFGLAFGAASFLSVIVLATLVIPPTGLQGALLQLLGSLAINIFILCIPISIAIAILRSRLWDIDVIINRALVYGSLTATLAALYFATVIGLQPLLGNFTKDSQPALVASTLVIAALFQPLRRRIQGLIDRRFYRHKYDAVLTLDRFAATLRQEIDLADLSDHLLQVVQDTMQPAHVSLWLRIPARKRANDGGERL
ncbi:MAG: hypothetical protein ACXWQZ_09700 [Ktedonobacterales bacterium]